MATARVGEGESKPLGRAATVAFLLLMSLGWFALLLASHANSNFDLSLFLGATRLMVAGKDPYDHVLLLHAQKAILPMPYPPALAQAPMPAIFFWVLRPLLVVPFPVASAVVDLVLLATFAAAFWAILSVVNVERRHRVVAVAVACLMPQTVDYVFVGNVGVLLAAAVGAGLWLGRSKPFATGLMLSLTILKPQIALPLAGLVVLFHTASRRRAVSGFFLGIAAILTCSAIADGLNSVGWWIDEMWRYPKTFAYQGPIASLGGVYDHVVTGRGAAALEVGLVVLAAIPTLWLLRATWRTRTPLPVITTAPLWFAWFLVAPYGHMGDMTFLAAPFMALLQRSFRTAMTIAFLSVPACAPVLLAGTVSMLPWPVMALLVLSVRDLDRVYGRCSKRVLVSKRIRTILPHVVARLGDRVRSPKQSA